MTEQVAIVTGGNRGIGLEVCRQLAKKGYHVILTSRDAEKGREAAAGLDGKVTSKVLDVASAASIQSFCERFVAQYGQLAVLVNNAGIMIDSSRNERSVLDASPATIHETLLTNLYGPMQLIQGLLPLMRKGHYGRIVNVSSGMGQISDMGGGFAGYRLSKAGLNVLTRMFDAELHDANLKINSMCPGWVRTDMGGASASRSVEQGADTVIWLATLDENGPSGGFFRDRQRIDW